MFDTPILFIVFNRPETTIRVFNMIKQIRPKKLFVAADGPRLGNYNDHVQCAEVKKIFSKVDWNCEVHTNFREENLGCGKAVSDAISWFFRNVDKGIILEDDTLPNVDFFHFCARMLTHYKDDEHIMHIGGCNFDFFKEVKTTNSFFLSNVMHVWGWASWKRAWQFYDYEMQGYFAGISSISCDTVFKELFYKTYLKELDTWDYQWMFSVLNCNGMSIVPRKNLIENIGFSTSATHTKKVPIWHKLARAKKFSLPTDLEDPIYVPEYEKVVIKNTIDLNYNFIQKLRLKIM